MGYNWANAIDEFSTALQVASTNPSISQIWVSDGTYSPTANSSFILPNNVEIYGGFPSNANDATHTSINTRGSLAYGEKGTVLQGNNNTVVIAGGVSRLDGFVLENGVGNSGGGISVTGDAVFHNLEIRNCSASDGGGIAVMGGSPYFKDIYVYNNSAAYNGGGMAVMGGSPHFEDSYIYRNSAEYGGGVAVYGGEPYFEHAHIYMNSAEYNGGGMFCQGTTFFAKYITIYKNVAEYGGGIYCGDAGHPFPLLIFENITMNENKASLGGSVYNSSVNCLFSNALIYGNQGSMGAAIYNDLYSSTVLFHATITGNNTTSSNEPDITINLPSYLHALNSIIC